MRICSNRTTSNKRPEFVVKLALGDRRRTAFDRLAGSGGQRHVIRPRPRHAPQRVKIAIQLDLPDVVIEARVVDEIEGAGAWANS